ncbi:MAG TPA: Pr6Pr family membrane protein [Candidatus Saccharimonadales bacterium]|nr:Pr6Pr family membrane protein [Candidatus Saccharimonadales bacterium]
MTVTFVVYGLLLSGTDVDTQLAWVNDVVHRLFPLVVIADWLVDPPQHRISFRDSLIWLVFPLAWTWYTLIRGAIVGWYPYPFLDPANGGYGTVAGYVVGIFVFGIVLCAVIAALGSALAARRRPAVAVPA